MSTERTVHIIGAGPGGLLLAALLQSIDGFAVRLYEKRSDYTRTRMVRLAPYLVPDSLESYRADHIDADNIDAVFDPAELAEGLSKGVKPGPSVGAKATLDGHRSRRGCRSPLDQLGVQAQVRPHVLATHDPPRHHVAHLQLGAGSVLEQLGQLTTHRLVNALES